MQTKRWDARDAREHTFVIARQLVAGPVESHFYNRHCMATFSPFSHSAIGLLINRRPSGLFVLSPAGMRIQRILFNLHPWCTTMCWWIQRPRTFWKSRTVTEREESGEVGGPGVLYTPGNFWKCRCKSVQFGAFWGHQVIKSGTENRRFSVPQSHF